MKKLFLVGALALFGAMNAQETKFGVKAGYSLSTMKLENMDMELDSKSSFYVGGLLEYKFTEKVGLQAELLYSETGGKMSESFSENVDGVILSGNQDIDLKLGNLMLPISVKYYPTENFSFSGGLNFAFILSAKNKYSINVSADGESLNESGTEDIKDETKSLNLAPFIGAEYQLPNGMFFDARYNIGVTNIVKDPMDGESAKNSFLQVGLGYRF
ncbi:porin family protein [Cloacibacterium normanense]|uniref:porin family protein n=1 Tax=Cloacibacterium normanense TaxID=237258 RepID=UPI00352F6120